MNEAYPQRLSSAGSGPPEPLSLSAFLKPYQQAIKKQASWTWIIAEISGIKEVKGQTYLSLEEYDTSRTLIASCHAHIWSRNLGVLRRKFSEATQGGWLEDGFKVMVNVQADLNSLHGFSVSIEDIDPTYTLGEAQKKLTEIRDRLQKEGNFGLNRSLPPPLDFCRVAVVAPAQAAGLGDFRSQADWLQQHGICDFRYYHAVFQGSAVKEELKQCLISVYNDHKQAPFDCVVILRGGGAQTDLAYLNEYVIAKAVCRLPLPVLTGIGHERDKVILDEVACRSFHTPSKVIAHIIETIRHNAEIAQRNWERLLNSIDRQLQHQEQAVERLHTALARQTVGHLSTATTELSELKQATTFHAISLLTESERTLNILKSNLSEGSHDALAVLKESCEQQYKIVIEKAQTLLDEADRQVQQATELVLGLGPQRTLARGYAVVRTTDRHVLTRAAQSTVNQSLTITFVDGTITAISGMRVPNE